MPTYDIQDADGKVILTLDGAAPPTDADIDEALQLNAGYNPLANSIANSIANLPALDFDKNRRDYIDSLPNQRIDELPEMQQKTSYFGGIRGIVDPEQERARVMAEFDKIPIGDEFVHPTKGRLKKTGGFSFKTIDPGEGAGFIDNVRSAGQIVRNAPVRLAIAFGASLAGDKQAARDQITGIGDDIETYRRPLEQASRTVGAAGARTLPVIAAASAPLTGGASLGLLGLAGLGGEALAETIEGRELNPFELGAATITAPLGINNLRTGAGLGRALLKGAGEGALIGGVNVGARKLDDIANDREVNFGEEDAVQMGLTTAFGTLGRGAEKTVNKGLEVLNKSKKAQPMANVATQNASNIGSDTNALQASINQVTTPPPAQQSASVFEQALNQQDELAEVQKALEVQETNKAIQNQLAKADAAAKLRQSQEGKDKLREQLALEQAIAERAAIQQERQLADIQAEATAFPELQENFPDLSPQAQRMFDNYGRVDPSILPLLGSGAVGGVAGSAFGATQGDTPEERARNAALYGGLGLVGAPALTALGRGAIRKLDELNVPVQRRPAFDPIESVATQQIDDIQPAGPRRAPAVFRGIQEGAPELGLPDIELYNLTEAIPGHPANSTVSRQTLEKNGFILDDIQPKQPSLDSIVPEAPAPALAQPGDDIEFLYSQNMPTRDGGERSVNFFQVDKTPDNPRGLTLDDAGMLQRGFTQEQINKMAADRIGAGFAGDRNTGSILNPIEELKAFREKLRGTTTIDEGTANAPVPLPETAPDEFVRGGIKNAIKNRDNPLELRQTLAENPDVVEVRHSMTELVDRMEQLDEAALRNVIGSTESTDFDKLGAQATLFNRLNAEGRFEEAAPFMVEATKAMTPSAQIINYGKLFKNPQAYAEGINEELKEFGRTLSGKQYEYFTRLGQADIGAEERFRKALNDFKQDINPDTIRELNDAEKALGPIKKELAEKTASFIPKRAASLMAQRIKLGLLSVPTISVGFVGNTINLGMLEATQPIVAGIDALRSALTGAPRQVANAQSLKAWNSSAKTFARNFKEIFTGAGDEAFALGRGSVGATPIRDMRQAFGPAENFPVKVSGDKQYVPTRDRAMRLLRGITGVNDAVMQRLINLSDNPFREFRRVNLLEEQANLRGLKGEAREQFISAPPPEIARQVEKGAADATFAEDNLVTPWADKAIKALPKYYRSVAKRSETPAGKLIANMTADASELATVTQVPFSKFPVNFTGKAITLGVPGAALVNAAARFAVGDIRKGEELLRDAMLNAAGIAAGVWLYNKGAVTAPPSADPKKRLVDYSQIGAGKINLSQIQRALNGEWKEGDPVFQQGDVIRDLAKIGPMSAPILLTAKYLSKRNAAPQQVGDKKQMDEASALMTYLSGVPSFMLEQSPLTGARSFLQALADSDDEDKLKSWMNNTTRAVVSGALPATLDKMANFRSYPQLLDTRPENANPLDMAKAIVAYKLQQIPAETAIKRIDVWGREIDANKGVNAFYKQFIDPVRTEVVTAEPWEIEISKIYRDSGGNPDVYPNLPSRNVQLDQQSYTLDKKDAEILAKERGNFYAINAQLMMQDPRFAALGPQSKVYALSQMYDKINTTHGKVVRNSPDFISKYGDQVERKTTKKLAIEESQQQ